MFCLQVAPRNPVALTDSASNGLYGRPAERQVLLVAFSGDGRAMATVDIRPDTSPFGGVDATLKFWDRTSSSSSSNSSSGGNEAYALNTRAELSHSSGVVQGLAYHPTEHMVATTSSQGEFKVWVRNRVRGGSTAAAAAAARDESKNEAGAGSTAWRCSSVGSYKGSPLGCCSFSPDGSLLAVAAGARVTLWDPYSNSLVAVLAPPEDAAAATGPDGSSSSSSSSSGEDVGQVLLKLAFLTGSPHIVGVLGSPHAAAHVANDGAVASWEGLAQQPSQQQRQQQQHHRQQQSGQQPALQQQRLVVWDLLRASVSWCVSIPCCSLAVDARLPLIAVGVPATAVQIPVAPADSAAAAGAGPTVAGGDGVEVGEGGLVKVEKMQKLRVERDPEAGPSRAERRQEWRKEKVGASEGLPPVQEARLSRGERRAQRKAASAAAAGGGGGASASQEQQGREGGGGEATQLEAAQAGAVATAASTATMAGGCVQEVMVGMVVVFGVQGPQPLFACMVPGSSPQYISFVPLDTPLGAVAAAGELPQGMSPLLVMTQDRRYALPSGKLSGGAVAVAGKKSAVAGGTGVTEHQEDGQQLQGLEAVYGKGLGVQGGQRGGGVGGQVKVDFRARQAALQQLFDTPSHVLPPPSALVPTMLELLIKGEL